MPRHDVTVAEDRRRALTGSDCPAGSDPETLFHRLNNQLGVILAHAELLESKSPDDSQRARATQMVSAALEALAVTHRLRGQLERL